MPRGKLNSWGAMFNCIDEKTVPLAPQFSFYREDLIEWVNKTRSLVVTVDDRLSWSYRLIDAT